jgi:hypothetical protein
MPVATVLVWKPATRPVWWMEDETGEGFPDLGVVAEVVRWRKPLSAEVGSSPTSAF